MGLKDFDFIKVLGVGAFGSVWLAKKIQTGDLYAIKIIYDCNQKMDKNKFENLKAESNIF